MSPIKSYRVFRFVSCHCVISLITAVCWFRRARLIRLSASDSDRWGRVVSLPPPCLTAQEFKHFVGCVTVGDYLIISPEVSENNPRIVSENNHQIPSITIKSYGIHRFPVSPVFCRTLVRRRSMFRRRCTSQTSQILSLCNLPYYYGVFGFALLCAH